MKILKQRILNNRGRILHQKAIVLQEPTLYDKLPQEIILRQFVDYKPYFISVTVALSPL